LKRAEDAWLIQLGDNQKSRYTISLSERELQYDLSRFAKSSAPIQLRVISLIQSRGS